MSRDRLIYVPLGGAGEIGMNMYVYGYGPRGRERFILVDSGVMFPDMETTPGVNLIIPDFDWLLERSDRIDALFLTHAHEDHIGAVPFILEEFELPVYARPFTAELTRRKLEEYGLDTGLVKIVGSTAKMTKAGPFSVGFLPVSHSVPEASALLLEVPGSRIIHTGDFRLDREPVIGPAFDPELWTRTAKTGVRALMCDSTNVFVNRPGRSESSVGPELARLFSETGGMIAATTFASNLARLQQLAEAARASGRSVVLLGRAMVRMVEVARKTGVGKGLAGIIDPETAGAMPRDKLVLLTTGSQGEARSATSQLANGKFRGFELTAGDTLLFSSKTIPGNEKSVASVINRFALRGVRVIDDSAGIYHVSGHANRPDLAELYGLVKPDCVVPMHGEHRHLVEHAEFARTSGFASFVVPNGSVFDVGQAELLNAESVEAGRLYLDGTELIDDQSGIVRQRLKMARMGLAVVSLMISGGARIRCQAEVRLFGIPDGAGTGSEGEIAEAIADRLERAEARVLQSERDIQRFAERVVRDILKKSTGKSPAMNVIIHRAR